MVFHRVEEIEVWQRGCRLAVELYRATEGGKFDKDWSMRDQIHRAAVSIPANIAEGYERESNTEFNRFIMISRGSCGELRTHLYIAEAIGYLDKSITRPFVQECLEISSMITGLSKKLKMGKPENNSHLDQSK